MKMPPELTEAKPPRLIPTIAQGFNIVAENIWLIILPVVTDIALWLGPKVKLEKLLLPELKSLTTSVLQMQGTTTPQDTVDAAQKMWTQFFSQFNLNTLIRTFPVGLPSLVAREMTSDSPIKSTLQYQVPTTGIALIFTAALILVGFLLGTIYFNALSRTSVHPAEKFEFKKLMYQYSQNLAMAFIVFVVLFMLSFPAFLLLSAFSMLSGGVADFVLLIAIFIVLWLIMPLVFSPHGVFVINQKAFPSMLLSMRMVRFFLPATGSFIVIEALVSEGLNLVWTIPGATSWLTLVSILGHAFIVTALLAASFVYYRDGLRWMQDSIQRMTSTMSNLQNGGPFGTTRQ